MTNNCIRNESSSDCKCHVLINKMRKNMLARDERNVALEKTCRMLETHLNAAHNEVAELKELIARMNHEHELRDRIILGERP